MRAAYLVLALAGVASADVRGPRIRANPEPGVHPDPRAIVHDDPIVDDSPCSSPGSLVFQDALPLDAALITGSPHEIRELRKPGGALIRTLSDTRVEGTSLFRVSLGRLEPSTRYQIVDSSFGFPVKSGTRETSAPLGTPTITWDESSMRIVVEFSDVPQDLAGFAVTLVGGHTWLLQAFGGKSNLLTGLFEPACLARAHQDAKHACFDFIAIDRSGRLGATVTRCGDVRAAIANKMYRPVPIEILPTPPAPPAPISKQGFEPGPPMLPNLDEPRRGRAKALIVVAAILLSLFGWFARRRHAVLRFARADTVAVDRAAAIDATRVLRTVLFGVTVGAGICVGLCLAWFDLLVPAQSAITVAVVAVAVGSLHTAVRVQAALRLLPNPDITVVTDRTSYLMLSHSDELIRFVALPRSTLESIARHLPAARVVSAP